MDINQNYREAVKTIKEAILRSQYRAAHGGAHQQQGREPGGRSGPAGSAGYRSPAPDRSGPPPRRPGKRKESR